jgi:hypothetical protein
LAREYEKLEFEQAIETLRERRREEEVALGEEERDRIARAGVFGKRIARPLSASADYSDLAPELIDYLVDSVLDRPGHRAGPLTQEEFDYIRAMLNKYPILYDDPAMPRALLPKEGSGEPANRPPSATSVEFKKKVQES